MRDWSHVSHQKPEKDPFGVRSIKIWGISYRRIEDGQPIGLPVADFLISAADEKECRWYLDKWFAGVFGWSTDADDLYYDQWTDRGWNAVVYADEGQYGVKVEIVAEGILNCRGILFTAYTW